MREISTLEITALVNELNCIVGTHIDKFYELRDGQFRLRLGRSGEKINLNCILSHTFNKSIYAETPEEPTNFSMAVRARTEGLAVNSVVQLNFDRIIDIDAGGGEREVHLIFEMFGKGNFILADPAMKILLAYRTHDYRDRSIRVGAVYEAPKSSQITIGYLTESKSIKDVLGGLLAASDKGQNAVSALAKTINLGGIYIEEAFNSAGLSIKSSVGELSEADMEGIGGGLSRILAFVQKPSPTAFVESGKAVDYAICELKKYEGLEKKGFGSVSEVLDFFYNENKVEAASKKSEAAEQLRASITKQEALIGQIGAEAEEARASGESIFNNLTMINEIISAARRDNHITAGEMQRQFPEVRILGVDLKEKSVVIEI